MSRTWIWLGAAVLLAPCTAASGATLNTIYSFCPQNGCSDGDFPATGLVRDASGNLYGVAGAGGAGQKGVIFELSPPSTPEGAWQYSVLYSFCTQTACADGATPEQSLILDTAGNLYGTTSEGGASHDAGIVFELEAPSGHGSRKLRVLHNFCTFVNCTDGGGTYDDPSSLTYAGAASGALYDGTSPLYGTTMSGGSHGSGVAYALQPETTGGRTKWRQKVIYDFCKRTGCPDGANPFGALLADASGNLFGVANNGGVDSTSGVVFELSRPDLRWKEQVLHKFCSSKDCADGKTPVGPLIFDAAGDLLGVTTGGGKPVFDGRSGWGVAYKLAFDGSAWQESVLHQFCSHTDCSDGYAPQAPLAMDAAGNLFGATETHGDNSSDDGGTVYRLSGSGFKTIYTFCEGGGCVVTQQYPQGGLLLDADGHLFGTTGEGGANQFGQIFELVP